jgi:histidine ammonia-lyase
MLTLDGRPLTLEQLRDAAVGFAKVELSPESVRRMEASRAVVERILGEDRAVYGVNTGFGRLSGVTIPFGEIGTLQLNLIRSHACGVGEPLAEEEVRAMMLLTANSLATGLRGVRPVVAETLVAFLNSRVHPVVPSRGSVGASGDLAPLAHLALALIGEGRAVKRLGGWRDVCSPRVSTQTDPDGGVEGVSSEDVIVGKAVPDCAGVAPLVPGAKEGLALLNGTQAMAAVGGLALERATRLATLADLAGVMTLEALRDTPAAFDERIQDARPHRGQVQAAAHLRTLMEGSEIRESHREGDPRVQDAYSIRCMPQVHGAVRDALAYAVEKVEIESGSCTDNPLVFAESGEIVSGGNFHGAPLAAAFDFAAIALTDLASISERRTERLVNPDLSEGLPPFLTEHAGVQSGFMIAQVAAAALVSECKALSHPASVDSIPTSGSKEDHVSMGMSAALKLKRVVENVERVLAIELLAAAQGLEFRKPLKPGPLVLATFQRLRSEVPKLEGDRPLAPDVERVAARIREGAFSG